MWSVVQAVWLWKFSSGKSCLPSSRGGNHGELGSLNDLPEQMHPLEMSGV